MDLSFKNLAFALLTARITKYPGSNKWADTFAAELGAEMQEAGLVSNLRTKDGVKGARLVFEDVSMEDIHAWLEKRLRSLGYTD